MKDKDIPVRNSNKHKDGLSGFFDTLVWESDGTCSIKFVDREDFIPLESLIDFDLRIMVEQDSVCTNCGKKSQKTPCSDCAGEAPFAKCVYDPGRFCTYNNCPFPDFKYKSCSQKFSIYMVTKSEVKVGISSSNRLRNRWYEQSADVAVEIGTAPNRKVAGLVENKISSLGITDRIGSGLYEPIDEPKEEIMSLFERLGNSLDAEVMNFIKDYEQVENGIKKMMYFSNYEIGDVMSRSFQELDPNVSFEPECAVGNLIIDGNTYYDTSRISGKKIKMVVL